MVLSARRGFLHACFSSRILLRFYELYNLVEASLYCWLILIIIIIIMIMILFI